MKKKKLKKFGGKDFEQNWQKKKHFDKLSKQTLKNECFRNKFKGKTVGILIKTRRQKTSKGGRP